MKSPRTYTAAEKRAAITRALEIGPAAAGRELGISSGTLSCWTHKARRGEAGYAIEAEPVAARKGPSQIRNQLRRQGVKVSVVVSTRPGGRT